MTKTNLKELIGSTNRILYVDDSVLETAPQGNPGTLTFFKLDKYVSCDDLEKEYASRGLASATIESLAAYDLKEPSKMDDMKYVATQWKDANGNWCYAAFGRYGGGRYVSVFRSDYDWDGSWWFAGEQVNSQKSVTQPSSDALDLALAIETVKKAGYQVSKIH